MTTEWKEIQQWLQTTLETRSLPSFEVTPETLLILKQLKEKNETSDKKLEVLTGDMMCRKKEYVAETLRLDETLQKLGMNHSNFKRTTQEDLERLALVTDGTGADEFTTSAVLLTWSKLKCKIREIEKLQEAEDEALTKTTKQIKMLIQKLESFNQVSASLKEQEPNYEGVILYEKERIKNFNKKLPEYNNRAYLQEMKLKGVDENLYHHKIVETYSTLKALKEQLQSKQEQLDSYKNLPPNMSLAKEKIQEAEEDLKKLEEMFETLLVK